jgi:hypothetical protein
MKAQMKRPGLGKAEALEETTQSVSTPNLARPASAVKHLFKFACIPAAVTASFALAGFSVFDAAVLTELIYLARLQREALVKRAQNEGFVVTRLPRTFEVRVLAPDLLEGAHLTGRAHRAGTSILTKLTASLNHLSEDFFLGERKVRALIQDWRQDEKGALIIKVYAAWWLPEGNFTLVPLPLPKRRTTLSAYLFCWGICRRLKGNHKYRMLAQDLYARLGLSRKHGLRELKAALEGVNAHLATMRVVLKGKGRPTGFEAIEERLDRKYISIQPRWDSTATKGSSRPLSASLRAPLDPTKGSSRPHPELESPGDNDETRLKARPLHSLIRKDSYPRPNPTSTGVGDTVVLIGQSPRQSDPTDGPSDRPCPAGAGHSEEAVIFPRRETSGAASDQHPSGPVGEDGLTPLLRQCRDEALRRKVRVERKRKKDEEEDGAIYDPM